MKTLLLAAFLSVSLWSLNGCSSQAAHARPADLARHWISESRPDTHGLFLRPNGTGFLEGRDPKSPGPPLEWYAEGDQLFIRHFGEEGEKSGYDAHRFTLTGSTLKIDPPVNLESTFRAK